MIGLVGIGGDFVFWDNMYGWIGWAYSSVWVEHLVIVGRNWDRDHIQICYFGMASTKRDIQPVLRELKSRQRPNTIAEIEAPASTNYNCPGISDGNEQPPHHH